MAPGASDTLGIDALRRAVVTNHRSWFRRRAIAAGQRIERVGQVELPIGARSALVTWQGAVSHVDRFVSRVRALGFDELGVAALDADPVLGTRFVANGFGWGWQPHWMGADLASLPDDPPRHPIVHLPDDIVGVDVPHPLRGPLPRSAVHLGVMRGSTVVGHVAMNPWRGTAGIYAMGVVPSARRQGIGRSLLLGALHEARARGCGQSILNATEMGEPLYRSVGFISLGRGQTWWLQPGPMPTERQRAIALAIGMGRPDDLERLRPTTDELTHQLPGGTSPIRLAVVTDRPRMVTWLLDRVPGLAAARYEPFQGTLLHLAAEWGRFDIAAIALVHGSDPTVTDGSWDATPADWARRAGRDDLVALLERW